MDTKRRRAGVPLQQRIPREFRHGLFRRADGWVCEPAEGVGGALGFQQRARDRRRRQPAQQAQQRAGGSAELLEAGVPGHGDGFAVCHGVRVVPGTHLGFALAPALAIRRQGNPPGFDMRRRLLQGEGEITEVLGQPGGVRLIGGGRDTLAVGCFEQKFHRRGGQQLL